MSGLAALSKYAVSLKRKEEMGKRIVRLLLVSFISFVLTFSLYPQESVATEQKCFLWRVQSESSTVYILGSIHLAKKEIYPLNKEIEDAFNKPNLLVVEVNINEIDQDKMQRLIIERALYPENDTLKKHISQETYDLTKTKLKEFGIDIDQFSNYKPWFLALTMSSLELLRLGFNPDWGIDKYFLEKAKDKKRILELETFDFQIKLFDELPDYYQELLLFYTIIDLNTIEKEMDRLINSWILGDTETMEAILSRTLLEHPKILPVYEKLIYERNRKMLSKIEEFLKTKENYFIVIGAGHLVGKKGIIRLLKEKGYSVEQL